MNNKLTWPLLALVAGFLVGKNWTQIEKFLKPYLKTMGEGSTDVYSSLMTFLSQQKEKVEDMVAESKIKKRKETERASSVSTIRKIKSTPNRVVISRKAKTKSPKIIAKVSAKPIAKKIAAKTKIESPKVLTNPIKKSTQFLSKKIQQITKEHPEGITLQNMAEVVGVHFLRLTAQVKDLMEKNKIRKEGKLYFSIS